MSQNLRVATFIPVTDPTATSEVVAVSSIGSTGRLNTTFLRVDPAALQAMVDAAAASAAAAEALAGNAATSANAAQTLAGDAADSATEAETQAAASAAAALGAETEATDAANSASAAAASALAVQDSVDAAAASAASADTRADAAAASATAAQTEASTAVTAATAAQSQATAAAASASTASSAATNAASSAANAETRAGEAATAATAAANSAGAAATSAGAAATSAGNAAGSATAAAGSATAAQGAVDDLLALNPVFSDEANVFTALQTFAGPVTYQDFVDFQEPFQIKITANESAFSFYQNRIVDIDNQATDANEYRFGRRSPNAASVRMGVYVPNTSTRAASMDSAGEVFGARLALNGAEPDIRLAETDQVSPAGQWRLTASGDAFRLQHAGGAGFTSLSEILRANADNSLTIGAPATFSSWLDLRASVPELRLTDTDSVAPAGQFRLTTTGDELRLQKATGVDFSSVTTVMMVGSDESLSVLKPSSFTGDTTLTRAIISGASPDIRLLETDEVSPSGQWRLAGSAGSLYLQRAGAAGFGSLNDLLRFDQDNSINILRTINFANTSPEFRFIETDQVSPAGQFRLIGSIGNLYLQRATAADFSSVASILRAHANGTLDIYGPTVFQDSVTISGGTITGITDLAVADGGTGGSTPAAARSGIGLGGLTVSGNNVTVPAKAMFHCTRSSSQSHAAVNTWDIVRVDTKITDQDNNVSTSNNEFTAPVTGLYLLGTSGQVTLTGAAPSIMRIGFGINGADPQNHRRWSFPSPASGETVECVVPVVLTAGWTVRAMWRCESNVADLAGSNSLAFWGVLL